MTHEQYHHITWKITNIRACACGDYWEERSSYPVPFSRQIIDNGSPITHEGSRILVRDERRDDDVQKFVSQAMEG